MPARCPAWMMWCVCFHVDFHATVSPFRRENNWGLFASLSFFFGPLVFSSLTPALPKAVCQGSLSCQATSNILLNLPLSRRSSSAWAWLSVALFIYPISGSFFLAVSCTITPSRPLPPMNSYFYRLAFHHSLVISLPFIFPFPRLHYEYFKGQKQNLLTVLGAYRGLWLITGS